MAIVRIDPFQDFAALQDRVQRLFGHLPVRTVGTQHAWTPAVDIYETDGKGVVLKVELPDMTREEIDVTVEHDTLTIRGERKPPVDVKEGQYRRIERQYGTFARSFTLPATFDGTRASAEYKNGVLTVRLPLREEAKPRTITVNVAA
jgi:HSP20 family protein